TATNAVGDRGAVTQGWNGSTRAAPKPNSGIAPRNMTEVVIESIRSAQPTHSGTFPPPEGLDFRGPTALSVDRYWCSITLGRVTMGEFVSDIKKIRERAREHMEKGAVTGVMSEQPRPYEPLTSENAALILIDHQVRLMTGVRD